MHSHWIVTALLLSITSGLCFLGTLVTAAETKDERRKWKRFAAGAAYSYILAVLADLLWQL